MSDLAETYKALKEHNQNKKQQNKLSSTQLLDKLGVEYVSKNNGIHLIVNSGKGVIDFYPSTGTWIPRRNKKKSRGVNNMVKWMIDLK